MLALSHKSCSTLDGTAKIQAEIVPCAEAERTTKPIAALIFRFEYRECLCFLTPPPPGCKNLINSSTVMFIMMQHSNSCDSRVHGGTRIWNASGWCMFGVAVPFDLDKLIARARRRSTSDALQIAAMPHPVAFLQPALRHVWMGDSSLHIAAQAQQVAVTVVTQASQTTRTGTDRKVSSRERGIAEGRAEKHPPPV